MKGKGKAAGIIPAIDSSPLNTRAQAAVPKVISNIRKSEPENEVIWIQIGIQFPPGLKKCEDGEFGRGEGHAADVSVRNHFTSSIADFTYNLPATARGLWEDC